MSDLRELLGGRYEALASAISETVSGWLGHDTPYNPHHWRCDDYPGPCGHDDDMTGEVMAVLGDTLPDLLAQAWDEGFTAGVNADMGDYEHPDDGSWHTNPYRQETTT